MHRLPEPEDLPGTKVFEDASNDLGGTGNASVSELKSLSLGLSRFGSSEAPS